jgi:hypothetical protein
VLTEHRLDDEQRAQVRDCLRRESIRLPPAEFGRFVADVEESVAHFRATPPEGTFRAGHDALRALWLMAHEDDPPIGQLRGRLTNLPPAAREYIGRRTPIVLKRLGIDIGTQPFGLPVQAFERLDAWARTADAGKLIAALRVLTAQGAQIVAGQSRGGGKRSRPRIEPQTMGAVRGAVSVERGGRPDAADAANRRELVMHLAIDWARATGAPPKSGRSDQTGFGGLVHSAFGWLNLPDGTASHALRTYWAIQRRLLTRRVPPT